MNYYFSFLTYFSSSCSNYPPLLSSEVAQLRPKFPPRSAPKNSPIRRGNIFQDSVPSRRSGEASTKIQDLDQSSRCYSAPQILHLDPLRHGAGILASGGRRESASWSWRRPVHFRTASLRRPRIARKSTWRRRRQG